LAIPEAKAEDSSAVKVDWKPSPAGAAFRSLALPGWGQAYVHKPVKAVIYGGIQHALVFSVFMRGHQYNLEHKYGEESRADFYRNERNRLSWYLAGAILLSTLDAYVDAHLYDFDVSDDLSESYEMKKTEDLSFMGVKIHFSWRFH
jgi:hypothetical protein